MQIIFPLVFPKTISGSRVLVGFFERVRCMRSVHYREKRLFLNEFHPPRKTLEAQKGFLKNRPGNFLRLGESESAVAVSRLKSLASHSLAFTRFSREVKSNLCFKHSSKNFSFYTGKDFLREWRTSIKYRAFGSFPFTKKNLFGFRDRARYSKNDTLVAR